MRKLYFFIFMIMSSLSAIAQIQESKAQVYTLANFSFEYKSGMDLSEGIPSDGALMVKTNEDGDTIMYAYVADSSNRYHSGIGVFYNSKEQMKKDFKDLYEKFDALDPQKKYTLSKKRFSKVQSCIYLWCDCHTAIYTVINKERIRAILKTLE